MSIEKYKSDDHINYIEIDEGLYKGVSYRINNTHFEEKDGHNYIKFDYDVKNLSDDNQDEFEKFLGEFLLRALEDYVRDGDV